MSTALLALAVLIGIGGVVFLLSLGLTALGVLLANIFPLTPFQGTLIHVVLFALAIFLLGLTLLVERIKDILTAVSGKDDEPLDDLVDFLEQDGGSMASNRPLPLRREEPRVGRNDPCPCGSGRKYKFCCMKK